MKSFIAAFIGLGFSYIGMAAAAEQTLKPTIAIVQPSVDELVEYFDTIVFGSEFSGVKASTHVKKWRHPLRVVVKEYGEVVSYDVQGKQTRKLRERHIKRLHFDYIQKHLNELAFLTGLKTEDAELNGKMPNLVINFVPRLQMANPALADVDRGLLKRLAAQGGCYFLAWPDAKIGTTIVKATIVVNVERRMARKDHCVLEEMTQSLGLPNDANRRWPSIFSNNGQIRTLSRPDKILIKTLYDSRLRPGMPQAEALAEARKVIGELDRRLP